MSSSPKSTLSGSSSMRVGTFNSMSSDLEGGADAWVKSMSMSVETGMEGLIWMSAEEEARETLVESVARGALRFEAGASCEGLEIVG